MRIYAKLKKNGSVHIFRMWLFRLLILCAPFSLIPYISAPQSGFASFRIGLYQVLLAVFVCVSVVPVWNGRHKLIRGHRPAAIAILGLCGLLLMSYVRAIDTARSSLLIGSLVLLVASILAAWDLVGRVGVQALPGPRLIAKFSAGYAVVSFVQLLLATFTTLGSLQCQGCHSDVFGFARVNGFALEPQFWANALLPFFVYGLVRASTGKDRLSVVGLFASVFSITLTFSRGALIALEASVVSLMFILWLQKELSFSRLLRPVGIVLASFLIGFGTLLAVASIKYHDSPNITYNTARGMIEQLSLGKISLPKKAVQATPVIPVSSSTTKPSAVVTPTNQGVVDASQKDRVGPAQTAIKVWKSNIGNLLFGVGVGNFSPYVRKNIDPGSPLTLTVYIYYVLVLVEMGVVGILLFGIIYFRAIVGIVRNMGFEARVALVTLLAFLVQYAFFGSFINVAYIWLWIGIALGLSKTAKKVVQS